MSVEQITIVKDCLDVFCAASASGQRVNFQKSSTVCFSQGVSNAEAREISQILDIPLIDGCYLGTLSIHGKVTSGMYQLILDKIMKLKLESWKAKYLTMAGRITLAQYVLAYTIIYHIYAVTTWKMLNNDVFNVS